MKDYADELVNQNVDSLWEYHDESGMLNELGFDIHKLLDEEYDKVTDGIRDLFWDFIADSFSGGEISKLKKKINNIIKIPLPKWALIRENFKEETLQ